MHSYFGITTRYISYSLFYNNNIYYHFFSISDFTECSSQTSAKLNDVFIVNLSLCKDINVKKDVNGTEAAEPPQSINLQRVNQFFEFFDIFD